MGNPHSLVWLDIETTGLNPSKDSILEVAAAIAPFDDPFNVTFIVDNVIWFHPDLVNHQDKFIIDMHTKNGLWRECGHNLNAKDVGEVENELLKFITIPQDHNEFTLAGSSVHFDHSFITAWMPRLTKRLSHRHYDVSSIELFARSHGMLPPEKAGAHRAMPDILESIKRAKACRDWLMATLQ